MLKSTKHTAFSLVELLLILVIIALLAVGSYNAVYNYYRTSVMDSELQTIASTMHSVRQQAIANADGSDYSVKFLGDSYVVFPGSVYNSNGVNNKSYPLDNTVLVSTTYTADTATFNNFTGRTGVGGSVTLSAFGFTKQIIINELGIVEDII